MLYEKLHLIFINDKRKEELLERNDIQTANNNLDEKWNGYIRAHV